MAREMKDSGILWIGDIPAEWTVKKLKFLASFCQEKYQEDLGNLDYIGLENIVSWSGKLVPTESEYDKNQSLLFQQNDILWGKLRPYLAKVFHCQNNGCCSGEFCVIRPQSNIDVHFLWNTLTSTGFVSTVDQSTYGTKMPRANADFIKNMLIPVPPMTEQERIGIFLDMKCKEIDSVLDKTRTSIEEYKKLKQAIITQAVTKGIRGERPMKKSGVEWIKELPSEWVVIPSKYLFGNSDERKHSGDELLTASQKYGIISQTGYMERENTGIVLATKGIENWKHVEPYDFIISLRSFQGGLEMSEISGCITWHYIVLKPLKLIHSFYYKWLFKSELYIKALQRTCNFIRDGQDLRYSNFVQVPLFIPPLEEQKEIADALNVRCAEIDALIQKKLRFVAELESYKKSLINEYVTGKKEVPETKNQSFISFIDARALLMCRIIELLKPKGRIHLMKALYTVDCMLNLNSTTQYQRQKHGPYDTRIEEYEKRLVQNGWIDIKYGSPVEYTLTETFETYREMYQSYYENVDGEVQRLCAFLQPIKTSKAERVATLLAAWNDFVIQGIVPTDNQLVQEVRSNWTPNKAHSSESTWLGTLAEMKVHKIIPLGYGKCTVHMK